MVPGLNWITTEITSYSIFFFLQFYNVMVLFLGRISNIFVYERVVGRAVKAALHNAIKDICACVLVYSDKCAYHILYIFIKSFSSQKTNGTKLLLQGMECVYKGIIEGNKPSHKK